jgi:hypothetical protein
MGINELHPHFVIMKGYGGFLYIFWLITTIWLQIDTPFKVIDF